MCQYLLQANQPQLLRLCLHNQKQRIKELCEANVNQLPTSTSLPHCQQNVPNISMSKKINGKRSKFSWFIQHVTLYLVKIQSLSWIVNCLDKSQYKLDPQPLDERPKPKSGRSKLNLCGTILEGKSKVWTQKKN